MDRGTPGQMDPWAENPWMPSESNDAAWKAPDAGPDDESEFYMNHPNFQAPADHPGRPADADADEGKGPGTKGS